MTADPDIDGVAPGLASSRADHELSRALRARASDGLDRVVPVVYDEMRRVASVYLRRTRHAAAADATLGTTALVNEAYLRLVDQSQPKWNDRAHFLALAAVAMRHVLIDRARARARHKRGGGVSDVTFSEEALAHSRAPERLLEINDALDRLAVVDARLARVVEYRFFGGLSEEEIAEALAVTVRTVQRDWQKARALLRTMLEG